MVNYKDLGLVNTREMFKNAMAGKYAIAAFNFNNMEQNRCRPLSRQLSNVNHR